MRLFFGIVAILGLALVASVKAQTATIASFAGLSGCWERNENSGTVVATEMWMKPAGTSIMGMGRTVKNGKTVNYEMMRIEQRTDGIYFVAKPKANPAETSFKLKSSSVGEFAFENPEHDFPQRVIYKVNGNSLRGRIEGTQNGKSMGFDFPMTRVKCD
jgi:hypothetical protein